MKYFNHHVIATLTLLLFSHTTFCTKGQFKWDIKDQTFDVMQGYQQLQHHGNNITQRYTQVPLPPIQSRQKTPIMPIYGEVYATSSANLTKPPLTHFLPSRVAYAKQLEERNKVLIEENRDLTQQIERMNPIISRSIREKIEEISTHQKEIKRIKRNLQYHLNKRKIELQKARKWQLTAAFKLYTAHEINRMIRREHSQKGKTSRIN